MSKPIYLANLNHHPMDDRISFEEESHIYTIDGDTSFTSVTTFVHHHFPRFNPELAIAKLLSPIKSYRGKTSPNKNKYREKAIQNIKEENPLLTAQEALDALNDNTSKEYKEECGKIAKEWQQTSTSGTQTHADIEYFYNQLPIENISQEYAHFQEFNRDFMAKYPTYRPYRTEWTVFYKELKLAGSIDMIYENTEDGTLMIYDWKRVKEIKYEAYENEIATNTVLGDMPNSNFWHYSLQLNTYKAIIEAQYGKKVTKLVLVRLYPDAPTYELHECVDLQREVSILFDNRRNEISGL